MVRPLHPIFERCLRSVSNSGSGRDKTDILRTVNQFSRPLPIVKIGRITDEWNDAFDNDEHGIHRHDLTNGGETPRC